MRRFWAAGLAGLLLAVTAAAAPASACGCGAIAPPPGTPATVVSETAVISYADGVEHIDYSLGIDSTAAEAGLIVPTPGPATVTAGDPDFLAAVQEAGSPRPEYLDDWWGTGTLPEDANEQEPTVLSTVTVGGLEAATLSATDSAGLRGWLQQNGFEIPAETASALEQYVAQRWFFVAIKLSTDAALAGRVDPIRVSFPTASLVYPIGMSKTQATPQDLRLYVLWDHRAELRASSNAPLNAAQRTVWAGPLKKGPLAAAGSYLTVFDVRYDQPTVQISGDIGVVRAANDDPVNPTATVIRPIELLGVPLGTLLALWGGLGLLLLAVVVVSRVRLH